MAGPRITEVSLSPAGSLRYTGAARISVLMVLLATQTDSRFSVRERRVGSYEVVKVPWHGDAFTYKKPHHLSNLEQNSKKMKTVSEKSETAFV